MRSVALLLLIGCAGASGKWASHGRACITATSAPEVGRRGVDEAYAILWREHRRADKLRSPVLAGKIVERMPAWILDATDLSTEPDCSAEIVAEVGDETVRKPITFDRLLVGQIRAVGTTRDTTDVMEQKAQVLIAFATMPDADLTDYQLDASEAGPPPPKSYVRELALGYLAKYASLDWNTHAGHGWLEARIKEPLDARDALLLRWKLEGAPAAGAAQAWLAKTSDPVALSALIERLRAGADAKVVDQIIAARGRVPVTEGIANGDRDLFRAALAARYDAATPHRGYAVPAIATLRDAYDPWRDWLDKEPANARLPASTRALRFAELQRELERARGGESRCAIVGEMAAWAGGDADFDAMLEPVLAGGAIHDSYESLCRIGAAMSIEGVSADRRARALVTLLTTTPLPYDTTADDLSPGVVLPSDPHEPAMVAASALGKHPEWITEVVRPTVVALVTSPVGASSESDELLASLAPAFDRLLAGPDGAAISKAWLADVPRSIRDPKPTWSYASDVDAARLLALAEHASQLGLSDDVRALLAETAALAPPTPDHRYTHAGVVRAAAIALAAM